MVICSIKRRLDKLSFTEEQKKLIDAKREKITREIVDILLKHRLSNEEAGAIIAGARMLFSNLVVTSEVYKYF
jgi:hypothetical protein